MKLPGLPSIEVVPDEGVKDAKVVVCAPVTWGPASIPGSTERPCDDCGVPLWLSPATDLVTAVHGGPELQFLCPDCLSRGVP